MSSALVAVPGEEVTPALEWAIAHRDALGDDMVVVSALDPVSAEVDPVRWAELREARVADLHRVIEAVAPGSAIRIEILEGDPHEALIERAQRADVATVVVGQRGVRGTGGLHGRGVALELVHDVKVPVAVIHEDGRGGEGPVLVGVDGSESNARAVDVAENLAKHMGREVLALFCPDPIADSYPRPEENWTYQHERDVRRELGGALPAATELAIVPGHPVETIRDEAIRRDAAAVVVGTKGRGGFHGLIVGRVPVQLIRHVDRPLVVVP